MEVSSVPAAMCCPSIRSIRGRDNLSQNIRLLPWTLEHSWVVHFPTNPSLQDLGLLSTQHLIETNLNSKFPQIHKYIRLSWNEKKYGWNMISISWCRCSQLNGNTVVSIPKPRVLGLYKMGLVNPSHLGWSSKQEIQESSKRGVRISKRVAA